MRLGIRFAATAAASAVLLATAGCGDNPSGVDGDLTNAWGPMAPAAGFQPNTSVCHATGYSSIGSRDAYEETDCLLSHRTETTFVGTYTGAAADADEPPADGSAGARAAYKTCDDETATYVGGPWRTARLWIGVTHPTPAAWGGGSRWFSCQVLELSSVEDGGAVVARTGTLRSALVESGSDLLLTCYGVHLDSNGAIDAMPAVACSSKHNAEFVGVWDAGKLAYPKDGSGWAKYHDACRKLAAAYVGVPDDADLRYRTGVVSLPGGSDVWALGDHEVRCYLWLDGAALTGSLKAMGANSLPVQYK